MKKNNPEESYERFDEVDKLIEFVRANVPETQMLDLHRYNEVEQAKRSLDRILREINATPSTLEIMPMFAAAVLRAEVESLEVCKISNFIEAISKANNFEVYPLENGNLRLAITFFRVMVQI